VSPSTITRWLQKAGQRAAEFHAAHATLKEAVEVQLDELRCQGTGAAKNAWAFSGVEVRSRFWATLTVGNRTLRNTLLFARQLRTALIGQSDSLLVTSDSFQYYEPVMRRVFGESSLVYVQVKNRYSRRGILQSDSTLVLGTPAQYAEAMERSEDSKKPNTAYIERLNLRKRMCCSMLRRRNPAPGRSPQRIQEALELVRVFYNFVMGHSSLKFGKVKRTPAMQAGIFDRPLTIREIFMWIPPAGPKWGMRAASVMARSW
jgi:IS1 family transposase